MLDVGCKPSRWRGLVIIHKAWQQTPCVSGAGREAACISARRPARQILYIQHPTSYIFHALDMEGAVCYGGGV